MGTKLGLTAKTVSEYVELLALGSLILYRRGVWVTLGNSLRSHQFRHDDVLQAGTVEWVVTHQICRDQDDVGMADFRLESLEKGRDAARGAPRRRVPSRVVYGAGSIPPGKNIKYSVMMPAQTRIEPWVFAPSFPCVTAQKPASADA